MPLPEKQQGETKEEFITRCMGDAKTVSEYPDGAQRFAVCQTQWQK